MRNFITSKFIFCSSNLFINFSEKSFASHCCLSVAPTIVDMGTTISVTGAVFSNTTSGGGPAFLTASVTSASCQNQTTGALVNQINNPNAKFYNGPGVTFSNLGAVPNLNGIPKSDFADNCSFNMVASLNGGNIGSCSTGEIQCVWGSSLPFTGTNGGALAAGINLTITPTDICDGPITLSGSVTGFGCNDGLGEPL